MRVTPTPLPGVLILEPEVFSDQRGFFMESFNQRAFEAAVGEHVEFVQDNHSRSQRGVLRGLHYQLPPHAQGKLVRVVSGRVFDVAVDLRRSSTTFGAWTGHELSVDNFKQIWIPPGFAHGFLVLSESADVVYKATHHYAPSAERTLHWNDSTVAIDWPYAASAPTLSLKDGNGSALTGAEVFC